MPAQDLIGQILRHIGVVNRNVVSIDQDFPAEVARGPEAVMVHHGPDAVRPQLAEIKLPGDPAPKPIPPVVVIIRVPPAFHVESPCVGVRNHSGPSIGIGNDGVGITVNYRIDQFRRQMKDPVPLHAVADFEGKCPRKHMGGRCQEPIELMVARRSRTECGVVERQVALRKKCLSHAPRGGVFRSSNVLSNRRKLGASRVVKTNGLDPSALVTKIFWTAVLRLIPIARSAVVQSRSLLRWPPWAATGSVGQRHYTCARLPRSSGRFRSPH